MTPEEQRIALAEWAGWKYSPSANSSIKHEAIMAWYRPGNSPWHLEQLPDYLNDLNAVHELEEKQTFEQAEQFEDELCHIVVKCNEQRKNQLPWRFAVAHATAAERAEAFGKALNLW